MHAFFVVDQICQDGEDTIRNTNIKLGKCLLPRTVRRVVDRVDVQQSGVHDAPPLALEHPNLKRERWWYFPW
eukprot:scaffold626_cov337-Pavlova_lutheri.AAC.2